MHALIIEQEAWIALMIEDALTLAGYTSFDVAVSGEDALAMAVRRCPDLITSDVRLGTCCGIETVRNICGGRHIPVIFVTATCWDVRSRSTELTVVQKPFALHEMKDAIATAVMQPAPAAW